MKFSIAAHLVCRIAYPKQLAKHTFRWALCTQYPLAINDLTVAVLLDPG